MNEKENKQQVNKPSEAIEDLTVNEAEAEEVKGGGIEQISLNYSKIEFERTNPDRADYDLTIAKKI